MSEPEKSWTGTLCPICGRALMKLDENIGQCFRCGAPLPTPHQESGEGSR